MIRIALGLALLLAISHQPLIQAHRGLASKPKPVTGSSKKSAVPVKDWILRGTEADIMAFTRAHGLNAKSLFAPNERKILVRKGRSSLASTRVVKLSGEAEAGYLRGVIRKKKLNLSLQPDFTVRVRPLRKTERKKITVEGRATDPLSREQWALKNRGLVHREFIDDFRSKFIQGVAGEDVNLPARSKEGEGIIVAILDTGMDITHPDLKNQVAYKPGECKALEAYKACVDKNGRRECEPLSTVDTDGNGYPLDCHGWNMTGDENEETGVVGDQEMKDPEEIAHGSHVAGIIAAESQNNAGIRGIAPKAKILPVRVIDSPIGGGEGSVAHEADATSLISVVVRGMLYAVNSKANVINLSLGWDRVADSLVQAPPPEDGSAPVKQKTLMEEAVEFARSEGVLVVGSAGNDSTDALVYPCQHTGVLCVAAHSPDGNIASFSNYGSGVDIAAPGHDILSTMPLDYTPEVFTDFRGYDFMDGTSMAAPYVAGAAAILMSEGHSADETYARLVVGARKRPLVGQKLVLSGNLDVENSLKVKPRPLFAPSVKGVTYGLWNPEQNQVRLKFRLKNLWASAKNVSIRLSSADPAALSSFYRIRQSPIKVANWSNGEEKLFEFDLEVLDRRLSSDVNIYAEVKDASGTSQLIRISFIVSTAVTRDGKHPNAKTVPVVSGAVLPESTMYSISSLDGQPASDFLAVSAGRKEWKIQLVREENGGYVFGPVRSIPAMRNAGIRSRQRLDVNFDGKSEYVLVFARDGERPKNGKGGGRVPVYFDIFYVNDRGEDVFPMFTYKNEVTDMNLDHLQWLRMGDRLVQAWVRMGTTPAAEKPPYSPWDPNPKDSPEPRIYYHDPATEEGVRSIPAPKKYFLEANLQQSLEQRKKGEMTVILTNSRNFETEYFSATLLPGGKLGDPAKIHFPEYRNLRGLETMKVTSLQGAETVSLGLVGVTGINDQRATVFTGAGSNLTVLDQRVLPNDDYDFAYKVMGLYQDSSRGAGNGLATFTQANYDFLYRDETLNAPIETSLRRYTFLSTAMFARLFYPVVTESRGERLPGLFIADDFGAYLGAELIVPVRDTSGKTVALSRPAYLRFLNRDETCDWLNPRSATAESPSEAIYFCGDRFLRIPYRF